MAWAFQKDSELLPIFNHYLKKMQETGIIERLRQTYMGNSNGDTDTSNIHEEYIQVLGYEDVLFPFLALLAGLCVAFIQLGIEIATKCKNKSSAHKEQSNEDVYPTERTKEIIDDIYDNLIKHHSKPEDVNFLLKMRLFSGRHDT